MNKYFLDSMWKKTSNVSICAVSLVSILALLFNVWRNGTEEKGNRVRTQKQTLLMNQTTRTEAPTSLSLQRKNIPVPLPPETTVTISSLRDILNQSQFDVAIPDLLSSAHPFNNHRFLKFFLGHLYRGLTTNRDILKPNVRPGNETVLNYHIFKDLLKKKANENGTVIIATVDPAFIDMVINLFEGSFKKLNITNYIFACSGPEATRTLASLGITAITLFSDEKGNDTSNHNTKDFNRKTRYKTLAAIVALNLGYSVLVMDVDIVFMKNPLPFLTCDGCDTLFQREGGLSPNSGFYLAFPTRNAFKLHLLTLDCYRLDIFDSFNDQDAIAALIGIMQESDNLKIKLLDPEQFPNGNRYFEEGCRMLPKPCEHCVIVHNNDIISYAGKVNRFREHFMWTVDRDGYYSDPTAKYITYENPRLEHSKAGRNPEELRAAETALLIGYLLNRIVILPRFHCSWFVCSEDVEATWCPPHMLLNIAHLDKMFRNRFRESVFLQHPLVPESIKSSCSDLIFINTSVSVRTANDLPVGETSYVYSAKNSQGASPDEFLRWMEPHQKHSVIRFHSLFGNILDKSYVFDWAYKVKLQSIQT